MWQLKHGFTAKFSCKYSVIKVYNERKLNKTTKYDILWQIFTPFTSIFTYGTDLFNKKIIIKIRQIKQQ